MGEIADMIGGVPSGFATRLLHNYRASSNGIRSLRRLCVCRALAGVIADRRESPALGRIADWISMPVAPPECPKGNGAKSVRFRHPSHGLSLNIP